MASRMTPLRQARERELVAATRALFDEHGLQDAPVEKIAQQVGIARGLIYRHFSSKEELYVLTVTHYLDELAGELEAAVAEGGDPVVQLERCTETYADYCLRFPAFIDCTLALMRRPARELHESVSESVWLRLGQGIAQCSNYVADTLRAGAESGAFTVGDPDYMANVLWTQTLGIMHLARIRIGIRQLAPGVPGIFKVEPQEIVRTCVAGAMAAVGAQPR
ncbi:MAG TPA: TetR/AcrR family transcriptional regulator [Solirubrobacterales bacterium]|nr:TetR/AcrR family transcriptional regulator [Solirubrobacterales bacterium]